MIEGCPFLYQASDGAVYSVNENGVEVVRSFKLPSNEPIVAFVDGDENNYDPKRTPRGCTVQIILVSFPGGANRCWIKQARNVKILATKLWSPRELFLAWFVLGLLFSTLT